MIRIEDEKPKIDAKLRCLSIKKKGTQQHHLCLTHTILPQNIKRSKSKAQGGTGFKGTGPYEEQQHKFTLSRHKIK